MPPACPACGAILDTGLVHWHRQCGACSYEGSDLPSRIGETTDGPGLDEAAREAALEGLRKRNFQRILELVERHLPASGQRPSLLDVGSAHGWFIEACAGRFDATGIEPDLAIATLASARGLPVRTGCFPDVVAQRERFDVISFNDVLEHIPDLAATLEACHAHLNPRGLLVVNAPSRQGVFYRLARVLHRLGQPGPFRRLWQHGFPSPHVHYFDTASLSRIVARFGFVPVARAALPSIEVKGLYARIRYAGQASAPGAALMATAITAGSPLLRVLPADIQVWIFRRSEDALR